MIALVTLPSLLLLLSPEEADWYANQIGRPLPARVPLEHPVPGIAAYGAGEEPFVIFMNRHGGTYTCGDNDSSENVSTIACGSSPAQVGGWPGSDSEWQQYMDCSIEMFSRFNLRVTDEEPSSGPYVEAVVGGSPWQVGMGSGVGGVAPYQCGVIPRGVVYAFADVYYGGNGWWRDVCETAAQEVVHAFGLDHEYLCEDPMTYLSGCGEKSFQDTDSQCGEFYPRGCDCTGATQNSVAEMLDLFGPAGPAIDDPTPPVVNVVSPANGATLSGNRAIEVAATATDNIGVTGVQLRWAFNGESYGCPIEEEYVSCARSGDRFTWTLRVGTGSRAFTVRATDAAGNATETPSRSFELIEGTPPPDDPGDGDGDGGDGGDGDGGDGDGDDGDQGGDGDDGDPGDDGDDGEDGDDDGEEPGGDRPGDGGDGDHDGSMDSDGDLPVGGGGGPNVNGGCSAAPPLGAPSALALGVIGIVARRARRRCGRSGDAPIAGG